MTNLLEKTNVTDVQRTIPDDGNADMLNSTLQHLIKNINELFYKSIENGIKEVVSLTGDFNGVLFGAVGREISKDTIKGCQKVFIQTVYCILHHYFPARWKNALNLDEKYTITSICSSKTLSVALDPTVFDGFDSLVCDFSQWKFTLSKAAFADLKTYRAESTTQDNTLINEKGDLNG